MIAVAIIEVAVAVMIIASIIVAVYRERKRK